MIPDAGGRLFARCHALSSAGPRRRRPARCRSRCCWRRRWTRRGVWSLRRTRRWRRRRAACWRAGRRRMPASWVSWRTPWPGWPVPWSSCTRLSCATSYARWRCARLGWRSGHSQGVTQRTFATHLKVVPRVPCPLFSSPAYPLHCPGVLPAHPTVARDAALTVCCRGRDHLGLVKQLVPDLERPMEAAPRSENGKLFLANSLPRRRRDRPGVTARRHGPCGARWSRAGIGGADDRAGNSI